MQARRGRDSLLTDATCSIVLVHGFGGHPVRSWKWFRGYDPPTTAKSAKTSVRTGSFRKLLRKNPPLRRSNSEPLLGLKQDSTGRSRNVLRKNSVKSTSRLRLNVGDDRDPTRKDSELYWPLALLPVSCPSARILVWGYHTLVVDGKPLRLQNDIFAHGRDLLWDLATAREASNTNSRPIIFIAHSTGGIVVKEVITTRSFPRPWSKLTLVSAGAAPIGDRKRRPPKAGTPLDLGYNIHGIPPSQ